VTSGSDAGANIGGATMSWSYDNFGNRSAQSAANTAALTSSWAHYSTGNNRMTATNSATGGLSYDLSGDVLFDGTHDYLYDAEGRICASAPASAPGIPQLPGTGYLYGPDGERVAKGTITSWSCSLTSNGFAPTESYILGPGGEQVTVMGIVTTPGSSASAVRMVARPSPDGKPNTPGTTFTTALAWKHSNVYAAGKLLATYDANGAHYNLNDWLGTKRVQVSTSGTVDETCWSQPFGDNLNCLGPVADDDNLHFTSKQRDTETGNDYFDARYYASSVGRFMSPDWSAQEEPVPYAKLDDPQSLNLYDYMRNNPLGGVDPDGHCCESDFDSFQTPEQKAYMHAPPDEMDKKFWGTMFPIMSTVIWPLNIPSAWHNLSAGRLGAAALDVVAMVPGESVWKLGNFTRGVAIERMLGQNLPSAFPVIDRFLNGMATSIKSLDLNARTFQDAGKLTSTVEGYIDKVAGFKGASFAGKTIGASEITGRELQLAVPGAGNAAQQAALQSASGYAAKQGVKLTITQVH
jgi:RHS repeat-associated protein